MEIKAAEADPAAPDQLSQLDILIQLYEGGINFLEQAITACEAGETETFKSFLERGRRIIEEFKKTLNFDEGGQVPAQLNDLYDFMLDSLTQADLTHDTLYIRRVIEQLQVLLDGWRGVQNANSGK
ncbi:MAG: flagellar export chaperone FliS [Magnetococcales bacterium]|nr:flagellar export chaperone FliS [Magnetococcales bacterium]